MKEEITIGGVEFERLEFCVNREKDVHGLKSPFILGKVKGKNAASPVVYFRKPKWMSGEDFHDLVSRMKITITKKQTNE